MRLISVAMFAALALSACGGGAGGGECDSTTLYDSYDYKNSIDGTDFAYIEIGDSVTFSLHSDIISGCKLIIK